MLRALFENWWTGLLATSAVALRAVSLVGMMHERGMRPLRDVSKVLRRQWFEVALLLLFAGGMVQYGSTKGFLGATFMTMNLQTVSVALPTVTEGTES